VSPCDPAATLAEVPELAESRHSDGMHVLVVEDDDAIAVRWQLGSSGRASVSHDRRSRAPARRGRTRTAVHRLQRRRDTARRQHGIDHGDDRRQHSGASRRPEPPRGSGSRGRVAQPVPGRTQRRQDLLDRRRDPGDLRVGRDQYLWEIRVNRALRGEPHGIGAGGRSPRGSLLK
jgi:hypothetical protein